MLDEFALNLRKVSDESLGRDETPRHSSHDFSHTTALLVIEWCFPGASLAIEARFQNIAVMAFWRKRWKRHILFAMADLVPMAFWTTANLLEVVDGRFDESKGPWKMPSHAELLKTKSWQAFSLPWVNGRVLLKIDDLLHLPKRDIKDWKQNRSAQLVEGKQSFSLLWIQGIFAPGDNGKL